MRQLPNKVLISLCSVIILFSALSCDEPNSSEQPIATEWDVVQARPLQGREHVRLANGDSTISDRQVAYATYSKTGNTFATLNLVLASDDGRTTLFDFQNYNIGKLLFDTVTMYYGADAAHYDSKSQKSYRSRDRARPSGFIEITEFDPINHRLSGRYKVRLWDGTSKTDSLDLTGTFNQIDLLKLDFESSWRLDRKPYDTIFTTVAVGVGSASHRDNLIKFSRSVNSSNDPSLIWWRGMTLNIIDPRLGYNPVNLETNASYYSDVRYNKYGQHAYNEAAESIPSDTVWIDKFDIPNRKLSGWYKISQVRGEFENLQWRFDR